MALCSQTDLLLFFDVVGNLFDLDGVFGDIRIVFADEVGDVGTQVALKFETLLRRVLLIGSDGASGGLFLSDEFRSVLEVDAYKASKVGVPNK